MGPWARAHAAVIPVALGGPLCPSGMLVAVEKLRRREEKYGPRATLTKEEVRMRAEAEKAEVWPTFGTRAVWTALMGGGGGVLWTVGPRSTRSGPEHNARPRERDTRCPSPSPRRPKFWFPTAPPGATSRAGTAAGTAPAAVTASVIAHAPACSYADLPCRHHLFANET